MGRLFLLIAAACCLFCSAEVLRNGQWSETEFDFGVIREDDGNAVHDFKLFNNGEDSIRIELVRSGCGCTVPVYDTTYVQPGDTIPLHVEYNTQRRWGEFEHSVNVYCSPYPHVSELTIRGRVLMAEKYRRYRFPVEAGKGVYLAADSVVLRKDAEGEEFATARLEGYNGSTVAVSPRIVCGTDFLEAEIAPAEVEPGEEFIVSVALKSDVDSVKLGGEDWSLLFFPAEGDWKGLQIKVKGD